MFEYKLPTEWTWYREGHDDKIFREKKTKETFQAGLQYLPFYLQQALPDDNLMSYLEKNKLDPIRAQELPRLAWAEDKTKVEEEVLAYLNVRFFFLVSSDYLLFTLFSISVAKDYRRHHQYEKATRDHD